MHQHLRLRQRAVDQRGDRRRSSDSSSPQSSARPRWRPQEPFVEQAQLARQQRLVVGAAGRRAARSPAARSSCVDRGIEQRVGVAGVDAPAGTVGRRGPPAAGSRLRRRCASTPRHAHAAGFEQRRGMRSQGRMSSLSGGESITIRLRPCRRRAPVAAEAGVRRGALELGIAGRRAPSRVQARRARSRGAVVRRARVIAVSGQRLPAGHRVNCAASFRRAWTMATNVDSCNPCCCPAAPARGCGRCRARRYPKQFLPLAGDDTHAAGDLAARARAGRRRAPIVVANEEHRFLVAEQLRQIGAPHAGDRAGTGRPQHRAGDRRGRAAGDGRRRRSAAAGAALRPRDRDDARPSAPPCAPRCRPRKPARWSRSASCRTRRKPATATSRPAAGR